MPKQDDVVLFALDSRIRGVCLDLLRENLALTVSDIQALCQGQFGKLISTITLGELATGNTKPTPASSKVTTTKPPRTTRGKAQAGEDKTADALRPAARAEINTRTLAGRQAFDEAVFTAVESIGSPAGAGVIQRLTGGANMQIRAACNRLIEAGRLSWSGKARGTRYFPA